jgi:hypothetical protein
LIRRCSLAHSHAFRVATQIAHPVTQAINFFAAWKDLRGQRQTAKARRARRKTRRRKELISSDKTDGHGPRAHQFELGTAGFAFLLCVFLCDTIHQSLRGVRRFSGTEGKPQRPRVICFDLLFSDLSVISVVRLLRVCLRDLRGFAVVLGCGRTARDVPSVISVVRLLRVCLRDLRGFAVVLGCGRVARAVRTALTSASAKTQSNPPPAGRSGRSTIPPALPTRFAG